VLDLGVLNLIVVVLLQKPSSQNKQSGYSENERTEFKGDEIDLEAREHGD